MGVVEAVALGAGIVLAAAGGELFVRGAVGIARWARVPAGIVGATVAAFATSSPELSVAMNASLDGRPEVALGDALGSNVVNIGLVLGIVVAASGMRIERREVGRDLPFALAAPALTLALGLDGRLSRLDAGALLLLFAVWLGRALVLARRARSAVPAVLGEPVHRRALAEVGLGLVALVAAGRLIVVAAKGIGDALGLDTFVVGATLVAFGTSMPELATAITSRRRGHDEIGLGTVLGSNVFNNLWIVGVAALIRPIRVVEDELVIAIAASLVLVLALVPGRSWTLRRHRGMALLAVYVLYLAAILTRGR
jgi:cation:H+ antiporter